MGLHIYSGSLVRLFTNNWENEIQRTAREQGMDYRAHYANGEPKWPTPEQAADHVSWMKSALLSAPDVVAADVSWQDNVESYHTVKLHEEAREAICIVSAHARRPDLPMPTRMPSIPYDNVAYTDAGPNGYLLDAIAPFEASLIIPGTFGRISFTEDPLGEKRLTCSSARLRDALDYVQQKFWKGTVDPMQWLKRGLVFARNSTSSTQVDGKWIDVAEDEPDDSLKGNAEFAFAVYFSMLEFSDRHHTAIATW